MIALNGRVIKSPMIVTRRSTQARFHLQYLKLVIESGNLSLSLEIGRQVWKLVVQCGNLSSSLEIRHRVWKLVVESNNWSVWKLVIESGSWSSNLKLGCQAIKLNVKSLTWWSSFKLVLESGIWSLNLEIGGQVVTGSSMSNDLF